MAEKAVVDSVFRVLNKLEDQVTERKFNRLSLFLSCIDLGGVDLEDCKNLADLYRLIKDSKDHKENTKGILQYILLSVDVKNAKDIGASDADLQKAVDLLEFPTLLVEICQRLGKDSYDSFKSYICTAVLDCAPKKISSREHLMRKLIEKGEMSSNNTKVLTEWLDDVSKVLADKVREYQTKVDQRGRDSSKRESDDEASRQPVPSSAQTERNEQPSTVSILAQQNGVSEASLRLPVSNADLFEIANLIPEKWNQFLGLSSEEATPIAALTKWSNDEGDKASYWAMLEKFNEEGRLRDARKVCELAKAIEMVSLEETMAHSDCTGQFCKKKETSTLGPTDPAPMPPGVEQATIIVDKLWDTADHKFQKLYIHFMNEEVLGDPSKPWHCGASPLTVQTILGWVKTWNNVAFPNYPRLVTSPASKDQSHIRVMFGTTGTCYSFVGKDALGRGKSEHTMYLNLYDMRMRNQISLVLHEFGHALGLEHEHQRSDFWNVLEELVTDKPKNLPGACSEHLRRPWKEGERILQTKYDPESIMHYWFDKEWLLLKYRCVDDVELAHKVINNQKLTQSQKDVIEGVHKRDHRKGFMAEGQSLKDFEALNQAYPSMP